MSETRKLYDEIVANLSWYRLNTNFQDPMYQYMYKRQQEMYRKFYLILTNFTVADTYVVNTKDKILHYGTYECSVPEKEAYMDSWISCILFKLPYFLENLQIGYIGFLFVLPILFISIFGGIRESYRWFILNQAIWDAFVCYDFICARPTLIGWTNRYFAESTCFYLQNQNPNFVIEVLADGFRRFLRVGPFIPIFLLAFSRFICMYFSRFYKSFTKFGYKILIFIFTFNIACILFFSFPTTWLELYMNTQVNELSQCSKKFCAPKNYTFQYCFENVQEYFQCQNRISIGQIDDAQIYSKWATIFKNAVHAFVPLMFLLSIILSGFLFYKIATQLKFQLKTNRESFKQTIKISSVLGFQCIIMTVIFCITVIQKYMQMKADILNNYNIYKDLPPWLWLLQHGTTTTSLNMIRVFLDSILILTILTGYSRCMVETFKFVYLFLFNPKLTFVKIKNNLKSINNNVTDISILRK